MKTDKYLETTDIETFLDEYKKLKEELVTYQRKYRICDKAYRDLAIEYHRIDEGEVLLRHLNELWEDGNELAGQLIDKIVPEYYGMWTIH